MSRTILIVCVLAVVLRLTFSMGWTRGVLRVVPEAEVTDGYHVIAENLVQGQGYRLIEEHPPTVQRPPGYPLMLAAVFRAAGIDTVVVQILQALLGALGCWILYVLGRWVLSERLGLAAAGLYAVYPNSIEYASRLYAENLYFPLFLGFACLLCMASIRGSVRKGLATGLLWGAGVLTRGTLLALPAALPIGIALSRSHRTPASRWLRWTVPAALAAVLVVAPWTARNVRLTGSFIPVSSWGWAPFYHGIQVSKRMLHWGDLFKVDREAEKRRHDILVERLYGGDRTKAFASPREYVRHEEVARDLVLAEIRSDPLGTAGRSLAGIVFAWFQTLGPKMRIVSLAIHLPLLILFVAGAVRMAGRHPDAFTRAWPALCLIVFVNLFQAVVFPHIRYMSPAVALSFVFSGLPLADGWERWRSR